MLKHPNLAKTPPMGWNSWDVYGPAITEEETLTTAKYMANHLLASGWEYLVIDGAWTYPLNIGEGYCVHGPANMDEFGRFRPNPGRFPSSVQSRGFTELAQQVHALGLKFGIHVMRGIPRAAVEANLPVKRTEITCRDLANVESTCSWSAEMYGVRTEMPEAQAWYDSFIELWDAWGVDFVKMDDISSPYHAAEIEMVAKALMKSSRPILLSLSPGDSTPSEKLEHMRRHAHMWRITADFWDTWNDLRTNIDTIGRWSGLGQEAAWPDADMLPLGRISIKGSERGLADRQTRFTDPEQQTLIALWCIARSPLFLGAELASLSEPILGLLTHPILIGLNQRGIDPREIHREANLVFWRSTLDDQTYGLVINVSDDAFIGSVNLQTWGDFATADDVLSHNLLDVENGLAKVAIPAHGCLLLSLHRGQL